MTQEIQVGTVLMSEWPQFLGLKSDGMDNAPYAGRWSVVKALDGFALERKVRAAGWNFFFLASEVKAMFFGAIGAQKIERALHRILGKVKQQHYNGLEVTGIVAKRFLGISYAVVSAHSRHLQESCYLDGAEVRQLSERDAAWARG
jgi:hypothetical protein